MFDTLQAQQVATQVLLLESAAHVEIAKAYLYWVLIGLIVWVAILLPIVLSQLVKRQRAVIRAIDENFRREKAHVNDRIAAGCRRTNGPISLPEGDDGYGSSRRG